MHMAYHIMVRVLTFKPIILSILQFHCSSAHAPSANCASPSSLTSSHWPCFLALIYFLKLFLPLRTSVSLFCLSKVYSLDNKISLLPCLSPGNTLKMSFILFIFNQELGLFVYLCGYHYWIKIITTMNNLLLYSLCVTEYNKWYTIYTYWLD